MQTDSDCDFFMAAKDKPAALAAIKSMYAINHPENQDGGGYDWVTEDVIVELPTFEDAMAEWGYEVGPDNEDTQSIWTDTDRLSDQAKLLRTIAPYVKDGSYIQYSGEDGSIWRWTFKNGTMVEQSADITWVDQ